MPQDLSRIAGKIFPFNILRQGTPGRGPTASDSASPASSWYTDPNRAAQPVGRVVLLPVMVNYLAPGDKVLIYQTQSPGCICEASV